MIKKIRLISEFMSQARKQTVARHILSNISKGKGNQTIKLGQLIEYDQKVKTKI